MVHGGEMETRRKTRPGILTWTPAPPAQNSSTDASSSEDEDDFFSQMDENGIIGLSGLEEPGHPESPEPVGLDEANLVRFWTEKTTKDLKKPARENRGAPQTYYDMKNELKVVEKAKLLPGTEEDERHELVRSSGLSPRRKSPAEVSDCLRPLSQSSTLPHLSHFTAEELAAAPGIDAETLPDSSKSLSDSHSSTTSSPRRPGMKPEALIHQQVAPKLHKSSSNSPAGGVEHHEEPSSSPSRMRNLKPAAMTWRAFTGGENTDSSKPEQNTSQRGSRIPRFRKDATEGEEFRKGMLSHRTPNFSKVEHRVYFPKGSYNPPRSKQSLTKMSPEPPIAFKSPADIVKEVLFDSDESSTPSEAPPNTATFTVPLEFRCRQQASTLLQQLQDDYNRLLTKYAEAENTIDRLRLEAKDRIVEKQQLRTWRFQPIREREVNLNFDPPEAGPSVLHSGLNQNKFLKLDFSAAQRAEVTSGRPGPNGSPPRAEVTLGRPGPNGSSSDVVESPASAQQLSGRLFSQTERFLQQLQTFEDRMKSKTLSACEKMAAISQLSEGLSSLERSYLRTRDEHKVLQQRRPETCRFDPERELEGLIFQCGLRVEELKEPQTPPPPQLSFTSEEEETLTPPQSLPESPEDPVDPETSSVSKKSGEEEAEDEETATSMFCISKHTCVESSRAGTLDQTLKNLPERLRLYSFPDLKTSAQPGSEEEEETGHRTMKSPQQTFVLSSKVESDLDSPVSPRNRRPRSRLGPSSVPPVPPPARGRRRLAMRRSHSSSLSSLAETTSGRRSSKTQTRSSRVQSQDGLMSPETDSGFVGSSSGLLHRRATERISAPRDVESSSPRPVSPPPSPSLGRTAQQSPVSPQLDPNQPRRTQPGQGRRCSPQLCVSQRWQTGELRTETPSGSEAEQSDPYSGSPPAGSCLHGASPRAASFARGGSHNDAVTMLQVEVARLKEKIENYTRVRKQLGSVAQRSVSARSTFTPPVRFEGVWSDDSLGRRDTGDVDEELRRTTSAEKQKQCDVLPRSELDLQAHVSRWTQTEEPHSCSSRKTQTSDETDSRSPGRLCPRCRSNIRVSPEQPPGGGRELTQSCSLCLKTHKHSETDCSKQNPSPHQNHRLAGPPDRSADWRYFTAAAKPSEIQFLPVYPSQLLLCSTPLHSSPDDITGVRRPEERTRRSLSVDGRRSLDVSLNRAIRAARHMKHTSGHMARSLASGLQDRDQNQVTQSCSY